MEQIYLDYNATTPVAPEVIEFMLPYLQTHFGNPSSLHRYGAETKMAVEEARGKVAALLQCEPGEIVFTSGGTESNNYAIKGAAMAHQHKGRHIITSSVEHPAVFEVCRYLEKQGFRITYLPVDSSGKVAPETLEQAFQRDTILVSIMHANNEVGTIQPIRELAAMARDRGILFHTDAAQSAGKIPLSVEELEVDLLSIAGHKIYAPKGIGALYIRHGVELEKLIHGADHEQNLRAGTENVLEITGLGKACQLAGEHLQAYMDHYRGMRDQLQELLEKEIPAMRINGHPTDRLPNTLSVSFPGIEANTLISRMEGVAASAGAACHAESIDVSAVLQAMKVPIEYAMGTIRLSTGRDTTPAQVEKAAREIIEKVHELMPGKEAAPSGMQADPGSVKLTHYTHGLGCACKIEPEKLEDVLRMLPVHPDDRILVGTETSDDAAVFLISEDTALVQTLDFFTPIVDDAYDFGAIAAANALSDIYAMGAAPRFAMNIVGFPEDTLPMEVLHLILRGAHDKAAEAGIPVLGGHTIEDPEPKYGMVVSGVVHPDRILRNTGLMPGDALVLTKPLGTGILTTALKRGLLKEEERKTVTTWMATLNRVAAEVMQSFKVHACTDVTGFGLLGHLKEMTVSSECDAGLRFSEVPFLEAAGRLATAGVIPGGSYKNLAYVKDCADFGDLPRTQQLMLCDAQTSGGLLVALPQKEAEAMVAQMHTSGVSAAKIIGSVTETGKGRIRVTR